MFGRLASSEAYLNVCSRLYPTFIRQWIAFIFGRDAKRRTKSMSDTRETTLTYFYYVLIAPKSQVYLLVNLFFKVIYYLYSSVDCFHIW